MRIAVISDIHGNRHALETVLDTITRLQVDQIICAGDVVDPLPGSAFVLTRLLELQVPIVRGNHEDYVLGTIAGDPMLSGPNWEPVRQVARSLDQLALDEIKSWPSYLQVEDLIICHASPKSNRHGWLEGVSMELAAELSQLRAHTFVCGHWHRQQTLAWGDLTLITNGSVGMPLNEKPEAEFLLLESSSTGWKAEHRSVPYDSEAAWREYRDSGWMAGGGPTAWLLFDELRLQVRRMSFFIPWAKAHRRTPKWPYRSRNELASAVKAFLVEIDAWEDLVRVLGPLS